MMYHVILGLTRHANEYARAKTGERPRDVLPKTWKDNKHNSLHLTYKKGCSDI